LEGVSGQGNTEQEAIEEVRQKLTAEIARHRRAGGKIPWVEAPAPSDQAAVRWVFVSPTEHTKGHAEERVVKTPGVCGGEACINGTRLTVWGLVQWSRLGWDEGRFFEAYPQLTKEDLAAAWEYAEKHKDEIDQAIRENEEA